METALTDLRGLFQRHTRLLGGVGVAFLILALGGFVLEDSPPNPEVIPETQVLDLPVPAPAVFKTHEPASEPGPENWTRITVRRGQTLAQIFAEQGLGPRIVHQVVHIDEHTRKLAKIFPGDELAFQFDADGQFNQLEYQLDETTRLRVKRNEGGYGNRLIVDELVTQVRDTSGVIDDSLFLAGRRAGLTDSLIMELAGLFGWDIDFVLDIRSGDEFHLIYEELYRNGEFLRTGDILAATFVNQRQKYQAIRFETENGLEYFSPDGRNMKKAFLRAPLNFSYISSNFNPKRFHPILGRYKAHNGIDYRAPSGTPVFAAGNGKVIEAGFGRYNGNYVFIQHGNNIVTKYLHFSKKLAKRGQRVQQGQVIGYVGATGLAEAPHLHYEFVYNGVHRNPRTVDLPKADPLPDTQMTEFNRVAHPLLTQLDRLEQTLIAMVE